MRAGASSAVQQTLTSEAASVLKHSLSLARRRGHAQITPLHVAATLLTSRLGLLTRACLKSQPPHSSRALELCFNVALNRLPTTTCCSPGPPGPVLHGGQQPCLSNALVAALKRAQAHQRRGCIEQQQQYQQPLLAVKVELEQLVLSILDDPSVNRVMREAGFSSTLVKNNLEDCSVSTTVIQCYNSSGGGIYSAPNSPPQNPKQFFINQNSLFVKEDDVKLVIEILLRRRNKKRRNCVLVGDSPSITEGLIVDLMGRVEKGQVPEELKSAHFIKFHSSSKSAPLEVESNISGLRRKVEAILAAGDDKGVIVDAGDLKWTVEDVVNSGYNPVDHLAGEVGRLISCYSNSNAKVWLVATANYQTYMRSQMKQSPLDVQWALQPLFVPSGGELGLSLKAASFHDTIMGSLSQEPLNCCPKGISNYEKNIELSSNELPYWLKQQGWNAAADSKDNAANLKMKWNKVCQDLHQSSYPWRPNYSSMFLDNQSMSSVPRFRRQQSCNIKFNFSNGNSTSTRETTLSLGNSSVEAVMCKLLQENVPWQSESIPIIVEALMNSREMKKDTWLLVQGNDFIGKRRLALAITEFLLGSTQFLIHINLRTKQDIAGNKCEILKNALRRGHATTARPVVLLEDVHLSDPEFLGFLGDGFRAGNMVAFCKKEGSSCHHPIFILTKSDPTSYWGDPGKLDSVVEMEILVSERSCSETFHSDHKRKQPDWDLTNKNKIPRKYEPENELTMSQSRSNNNLDLNMKAADEEECAADETAELSPNHRQQKSLGFLDLIKNHFVFNRDSHQDRQLRETFLSDIRGSFKEVFGTKNLDCFSVEESVLEEISLGSGTFLCSLLQKWRKDIFQTSLKRINVCKKPEGIMFRLCVRGNGRNEDGNSGFMGSCLPRDVPITYLH